MFATLRLDRNVMALYESRPWGSEVLLFKRDEGLLGKLRVPEKGEAVEERLIRSFQIISGGRSRSQLNELLVPKRFDGVHLSGSRGGNRAKDNADTGRNQNGDNR
jgi:hypothetical protein